jgi:hypothetical protein
MKPSAKKSMSDRELKGLLASLKEDLAAPSDFRARILKKIAAESGQSQAPKPASGALSWLFARPMLVRPAALALISLGVWIALKPQPRMASVTVRAVAPRLSPAQPLAKKPAPAPQVFAHADLGTQAQLPLAKPVPELAQAPVAPARAQAQAPSAQLPAPAPLAQAQSNQVPHFASSGAASAPLASAPAPARQAASLQGPVSATEIKTVVVTPTVTVMATGLRGHSEVRRNKFLASRGEYAAILYYLSKPQKVSVQIFDRMGHPVALLQNGMQGAGLQELHWQGFSDKGDPEASGIYLVQIRSDEFYDRHKLVLIR